MENLNDKNIYNFIISKELEGERLDQALSLLIPDYSRNALKNYIKGGYISKDSEAVTKQAYKVCEGDNIRVVIPKPKDCEAVAVDIPLDILYEDEDLLIVNKPKGMVVHPAAGHSDDTLVNAILAHCGEELSGIGGVLRPGIVHRIDKDTTGALLICKNDQSHLHIAKQLKEHSIDREYAAIVYGIVKDDSGTIDAPIGRSRSDRKKMAVQNDLQHGKEAVTHYKVIERFFKNSFTYIACKLETGRTHQIRVHMTSIGHPLLGDEVYAQKRKSKFENLQGQCLHARTLGFIHPKSGERIFIEAPLPEYFEELLSKLS